MSKTTTQTKKTDSTASTEIIKQDAAETAKQPEAPAPVQAAAPQPAPQVKTQPKLTPARLKSAEYAVLQFYVVPEIGVTLEQVQDKTFFTHCAKELKPSNLIIVEAADGSYWAQLLVRSVTGPEVVTETLLAKEFKKIERGSISVGDYFTQWAGSHEKWRVMRKSATDQAPVVISSGHDSELRAVSWITEHQKALAA